MAEEKQTFDENQASKEMDRYSRAIAALGVDTMKNLISLRILVVGCTGVGVETAKNLVLQGPKAVVVWDDQVTQVQDLGANFYLREEHVGKVKRAEACLEQLSQLNPYVTVEAHSGALTDAFVKEFGAVIVTRTLPMKEMVRLNQLCRANKITFLLAVTHGVCCHFFSDFGDEHIVKDINGEPVQTHVIENINPTGLVTVASQRHGLDDGDWVCFEEVEGMKELNELKHVPIKRVYVTSKVRNSKTNKVETRTKQLFNQFQIDVPVKEMGTYTEGGIVTEVKKPFTMQFRSLEEALKKPLCTQEEQIFSAVRYPEQEAFMAGRGSQIHAAFLGLLAFEAKHSSLPELHNEAHAAEVVALAKQAMEEHKAVEGSLVCEINEDIVKKYSLYARAELGGLCAFLGGVVAQEVTKRFGKFSPVQQWLHCDHMVLLPAEVPKDAQPMNSRYDSQIVIWGRKFQEKLQNQKWFMVGCGALGCEYLKGFALMGIGTGPKGFVHVTDMDRIELSNLSRQFLFRGPHVGKPKSVCASVAAKEMNPDLKIITHEVKVAPETEDHFDDEFWESLDGVWNALDNVLARRYTDSKCLLFSKPLLESGTQGTKANSEIILPGQTTSYSDHKDQDTGGIAACTLRNFPHLIEHCIEWARPQFEELFEHAPAQYNMLVEDKEKFIAQVRKEDHVVARKEALEKVKVLMERTEERSFDNCIRLAFAEFDRQYHQRIRDLTFSCPEDETVKDPEGNVIGKFWSGHKRFPNVASFDVNNTMHLEYLFAAANLYAFMFFLEPQRDFDKFREHVASLALKHKEWVAPSKKVNVEEEEEEKKEEPADEEDEKVVAELFEFVEKLDVSKLKPLQVADFEKDDDTNFHIDFITVCSNLRAWNYRIKQASRHKCKMIAGHIIPALATTTAMVTGLVQMEFYKLLLGLKKEAFWNSNVNLAVSSFQFFEPDNPHRAQEHDDPILFMKYKPYPPGFTTWDKVVVNQGDLTLNEFLEAFPKVHFGCMPTLLFKDGLDKTEIEEGKGRALFTAMDLRKEGKLKRKLSELYMEAYGPISKKRRFLLLQGDFEDAEGNGADTPLIQYYFK